MKFILQTAVFLTVSASAQAGIRCEKLFSTDPFLKQAMSIEMSKQVALTAKSLQNSTTGARVESKWTLSREKIETLISGLNTNLRKSNIVLKARDKVIPGTKNVTHTVYLEKFSLNLKNSGLEVSPDFKIENVTLKVRIRKYGTILEEKAVSLENVQFASLTQDHSFVELKFPDARFKGAVFKPRMYMADKYIKLFGTADFLNHYAEIKAEVLATKENVPNHESVEAMLEFIRLGHVNHSSFKPLAVNLYERTSYALDFIDHSRSDAVFQIQMTLDKSIAFFVYSLGKTIEAYKATDSVVEIKTPVEYAGHTLNTDVSKIVGYKTFLEFVQSVKTNHLPEYLEGVGKMGHGHKEYLIENP